MVKNKKIKQEDNLQEVESVLTKTEQLIEENQKMLSIVIGVAVAIVVIYLGFSKFYMLPKEKEAKEQMYMAEHYFQTDSFNLAINGDGNYLGFLDIIDSYGITESANLANYYTGVSYFKLGEYELAIDYLNKFDSDDILVAPVCEGAKGDAYMELGKDSKALSQYKKAFKLSDNELTAPIYMIKAATVLEKMGKSKDALDIYNELKEKFPNSNEGRNADKYIARAKITLEK